MAFIKLEQVQIARALAMQEVLYPSSEYFWRKLCRWACEHLNASIFEAEQIPLNQLLRHYYEWTFEHMDEEERNQIIEKIIETPEQAAKKAEAEQAEEEAIDEFEAAVKAEAEAEARAAGYKVLSKDEAATARQTEKKPAKPKKKDKPADPIPDLSKLPPDVSIKFDDPDLEPSTQANWDLFEKP